MKNILDWFNKAVKPQVLVEPTPESRSEDFDQLLNGFLYLLNNTSIDNWEIDAGYEYIIPMYNKATGYRYSLVRTYESTFSGKVPCKIEFYSLHNTTNSLVIFAKYDKELFKKIFDKAESMIQEQKLKIPKHNRAILNDMNKAVASLQKKTNSNVPNG